MVISAEQLEKEEPVKALDDEDIELMKNYVIQFFAFFCLSSEKSIEIVHSCWFEQINSHALELVE